MPYPLLHVSTDIDTVDVLIVLDAMIETAGIVYLREQDITTRQVGCSKQTSKTYAFFAYSFTSFDNQIRGKVDISPFFDMAMSTCFQSFFEIEINSSDFISKMKT